MYSKEFYNELEKVNKEIYENKLILESVHPIDIINGNTEVLMEAAISKEKLDKARKTILEKMMVGVQKFLQVTGMLEKKNAKFIDGYKKIDLNLVNFDNFEYDMPDIKTALNNISSFKFPPFNAADSELILNNNSINYKVGGEAKFPQGAFSEDGQVNKAFFNGTVSNSENGKIRINASNAPAMFNACLDLMIKRKDMGNKIASQVRSMKDFSENLLNSAIRGDKIETVSESVLFNSSIFKDEYFDILLEDALATPDEIHKENEEKTNGMDTTTKEESRTSSNNDRIADAVIRYSEIVYSIQSVIMSSLDQLYKESGMFCEKVSQLSNNKNK